MRVFSLVPNHAGCPSRIMVARTTATRLHTKLLHADSSGCRDPHTLDVFIDVAGRRQATFDSISVTTYATGAWGVTNSTKISSPSVGAPVGFVVAALTHGPGTDVFPP